MLIYKIIYSLLIYIFYGRGLNGRAGYSGRGLKGRAGCRHTEVDRLKTARGREHQLKTKNRQKLLYQIRVKV